MKKALFFSVFVCLLAFSAFAQENNKKADFSGAWTLDAGKSKLGEWARIEWMTMTVAQTDMDIKVETSIKWLLPQEGAVSGQDCGGGTTIFLVDGMDTTIYTLDGKETSIEAESRMGPVKVKGELESGGKLKLTSSHTFSTQMGEATMTTRETWTLSGDGKTLTVKRDTETSRGTNSSEMVFTKK